jgi:hypothetical protein
MRISFCLTQEIHAEDNISSFSRASSDYTLARNIGARHSRLGCWGVLNADDLAAVTARLLPTSAKRLLMAAPAIRPAMASALGFFVGRFDAIKNG